MPFDLALSWAWSRIFTFRPKIVRRNGQLIARSDWRSQLFSLGFAGRQVVVDRTSRSIRIRRRIFWVVLRRRYIPFDAVQEVTYDYGDVSASTYVSFSHQQDDLFTV